MGDGTNVQHFPSSGKFVAVFHSQFGKELPRIKKVETIEYKRLNESNDLKGTKPAGTFRRGMQLYLYNPKAIQSLNDKGLPILKYIEGKTEPFVDAVSENLDRVNAVLFDKTFGRGEMRSVIAGSQKPKDEWDRKTLIVGTLMGMGLMFVIAAILEGYGVHL